MGQFKDPNVISLYGVVVKSKLPRICVVHFIIYTCRQENLPVKGKGRGTLCNERALLVLFKHFPFSCL